MFVTVRGRVYVDATGACVEIPVILTPHSVLEPLLDYFLARGMRSTTWRIKSARAVSLFLEYLRANPDMSDPRVTFQSFAQRLYTGTFDLETGLDPSGLAWRPRSSADAQHIVGHLTDFFNWLGEKVPAAAQLNPKYAGDAFDRMCDEAAYQYRRNAAFLGHAWEANATSSHLGHFTRARRQPRVAHTTPPAFPEDKFRDFLIKGHRVGRRLDVRNALITLLLHGAGFRESEPFHLYVEDVVPDPSAPTQALVRIHHPSEGTPPHGEVAGQTFANRAAYLRGRFGLVPRNEILGSRKAGWKGGLHDGKYYKQAYWFPDVYGEWFLLLWRQYLEQLALIDRPHPFAFVNLGREPQGQMYCIGQYNKAHAAACRRIDLVVSKATGTTPHGHRHAYCRRLTQAGVDRQMIRRFMHHSSIASQDPYDERSMAEMRAALREGQARLQSKLGPTLEREDDPIVGLLGDG